MTGLLSQYGASLRIAFVITLGLVVVAAGLAVRLRRSRRGLQPVARLLAVGSAVVVVVATALPRTWPPHFAAGDLVLQPGRGGLSDWRVLFDDPSSLSGVLLIGNLVLYVPLALFAMLGWPDRRQFTLVGCLAVSLLVESSQRMLLEGVASVDDVLLNMVGAAIGFALGLALLHRLEARCSASHSIDQTHWIGVHMVPRPRAHRGESRCKPGVPSASDPPN